MTLSPPTGPAGRMLALGLTLIMLASVWFAAASPLIGWYRDRASDLEQRRVLLRRMIAVAQTVPALRLDVSRAPRAGASPTGASGSGLLEGATDAVAAAALQQRVQDMATRAGATLTSAETLPATQTGAYRRIGLHVSLNAPWAVLVRLLQAVEQGTPRMLVDDLQLHGARLVVRPADPPLDAGFTVFAFRAAAPPR